jgi:hypothetical protein
MNKHHLTPHHLIFSENKKTTEASTVKNASKKVLEVYSSCKDKILSGEGRLLIRGPI